LTNERGTAGDKSQQSDLDQDDGDEKLDEREAGASGSRGERDGGADSVKKHAPKLRPKFCRAASCERARHRDRAMFGLNAYYRHTNKTKNPVA